VGPGGKAGKAGGRIGKTRINFGSFQGIPILSVNTEIVGLTKDAV